MTSTSAMDLMNWALSMASRSMLSLMRKRLAARPSRMATTRMITRLTRENQRNRLKGFAASAIFIDTSPWVTDGSLARQA
ncbi:hypothetical protein D3C72_2368340 [compost metagenome]